MPVQYLLLAVIAASMVVPFFLPRLDRKVRWILVGSDAALLLGVLAWIALAPPEGGTTLPGADPDQPEAEALIARIQQAEVALYAAVQDHQALPRCPEGDPGPQPVAFSEDCAREWARLGVDPGAPLRCRYEATLVEGGVAIRAECDEDGDGVRAVWEADLASVRRLTPADVR